MDNALSRVIIGKMGRFLNNISAKEDLWRRKYIPKLMSGIIHSQGLVVTAIARYIAGIENKSADAAWQQAREHLKSEKWDEWEEEWHEAYSKWLVSGRKGEVQVIIDISDLSKPHAQKMEYLDIVRDASESSLRGHLVTNPGYWECTAYLLIGEEKNPVPFIQIVYSIREPEIGSENKMYDDIVRRIKKITPEAEVIIDRGADRTFIFNTCGEQKLHFIIRQVGSRNALDEEGRVIGRVKTISENMDLPYSMNMRVWSRKHRWEYRRLIFGYMRIRYEGCDETYSLVVGRFVEGEKKSAPMILLTNRKIITQWEAFHVIRDYIGRWRSEDGIRFLKKELCIESVRVQDLTSIKRLVWIATLVMALTSLTLNELSNEDKLKVTFEAKALKTKILLYHYRLLTVMQIILEGRAWRRFLLGVNSS